MRRAPDVPPNAMCSSQVVFSRTYGRSPVLQPDGGDFIGSARSLQATRPGTKRGVFESRITRCPLHFRRLPLREWIAVAAAPLVVAVASVAHSPRAEACEPATPYEAEQISGDQPSCMKIEPGRTLSQVLRIDNECSQSVTLGVLECERTECDGEPVEAPAGEEEFVFADDVGLDGEEFDDGDTISATFAWTRAPSEEGTVEADFTYKDRSGACSVAGCGCNSSAPKNRPPLGGGLVVFLAALALVARRR